METLIGESANSQAPEYATYDVDKFEADFEQVMIGAYLKFVELNPGKVDKSWQDKCNFIHSIFDGYIVKAVAERQKTGKASNASMLHNLIEFSQDKVFLRDQLINVFLGAKDTAGIGIANVIFFLARHPRVYQKLREEIAQIGSKPLTFELLKSMKYLQSVIAESKSRPMSSTHPALVLMPQVFASTPQSTSSYALPTRTASSLAAADQMVSNPSSSTRIRALRPVWLPCTASRASGARTPKHFSPSDGDPA